MNATTPNLPGPERADKARDAVFQMLSSFCGSINEETEALSDALSLLDALPALQAEVERLQENNEKLRESLQDADRRMMAVGDRLDYVNRRKNDIAPEVRQQINWAAKELWEKAESIRNLLIKQDIGPELTAKVAEREELKAKLAAARPLIEAAMKAKLRVDKPTGMLMGDGDIILRAALAYREKAEKAGEKGEGKRAF